MLIFLLFKKIFFFFQSDSQKVINNLDETWNKRVLKSRAPNYFALTFIIMLQMKFHRFFFYRSLERFSAIHIRNPLHTSIAIHNISAPSESTIFKIHIFAIHRIRRIRFAPRIQFYKILLHEIFNGSLLKYYVVF